MKLSKYLGAVLGFAFLVQAAYAHHSTNGIYDEATEVELTGKVKSWRFINPHPSLVLEVTTADGKTEDWDISYGGSAVSHLTRRGYTADSFKPGDEITVKGHPALLQTARGLLMERNNPTRADGTPIIPNR
jgi:hypothetical protein